VPDDLVGRTASIFFLRDDLHQVLFDLFGVVVAGEFEAAADAVDVRVHDHAFVLLEP